MTGLIYGLDSILHTWELVRAMVERAMARTQGEFTAQDLLNRILHCKAQLWLITKDQLIQGVCITEVIDYPQKAILRIIILAGSDMTAWQEELCDKLVSFARLHNLQALEAYGRAGFIKQLRSLKFRPVYVALVRELDQPGPERKALEGVLTNE